MKPTLRRLADLAEEERDRLMRRSLDRIFDPELWASVRSLYEDVAAAGELVSGDLGCLMHLGGVAAENQVALATTTLPELLDREGWTP